MSQPLFPANHFSHNEDGISVENDKSKQVNGVLSKVVGKSSNREKLCSLVVLRKKIKKNLMKGDFQKKLWCHVIEKVKHKNLVSIK